jgi:phosphoribosyl 1,2-cyclic phosphodiesterase
MAIDQLSLRLHGVRGSVATTDPASARFGGDTISFEVDLGVPDRRLLIDCGTGVRRVAIDADGPATTFDILFSHFHWDHIEGLGFFPPVFRDQHSFNFHGRPEDMTVDSALEGALRPPWFPVALADTPSMRSYQTLGKEPLNFGGIEVTPCPLNHPQGVLGYRLRLGDRSIAIATDHEAGDPAVDSALVEWARGADVLIHDAQYTADDYEAHRGWGHSTWDRAIDAAIAAAVGRLVIVSHDPARTDTEIDALVEQARTRFPRIDAGYAGMTITV